MMTEKTINVIGILFLVLMITVLLKGGVNYFFGEKEEGEEKEGEVVARLLTQHPVSEPWMPDATLVTVELPIPIQGIGHFADNCRMGEIVGKIREGQGQGAYFKALLMPFREIPKGSKIQVEKVSYIESFSHEVSFLIVK